jgi:hypothetical protein
MTIFGVVLAIGFLIVSWFLNRDQSDRYPFSPRISTLRGILAKHTVPHHRRPGRRRRRICRADRQNRLLRDLRNPHSLAAGSYSFAVAFRRHLERTIK